MGSDPPKASSKMRESVSAVRDLFWKKETKDRMEIFWTLPHLVTLVSFLVLVGYVSASVQIENSRQMRAESLAQRCAFVYLVSSNKSDIDHLGYSIQSLNKYSAPGMAYKIVVVHEGIPPVVQGRVQSLSEAPIEFRDFSLDGPPTLNLSNEISTFSKRTPWGYQKMIRFWFYSAILADPSKAAPLSDLDYIVRLDSDTAFTHRMGRDFFNDFVLSGAQYGYQRIAQDCSKNYTTGLRELAESFIEVNGITPRSKNLWYTLSSTRHKKCVAKFENHFELINLRFFRSHAGIQDWIRVVDANGGIFRHRWGNAALRFITVALYAAPEKVVRYEEKEVSYCHPHRMGKGNPSLGVGDHA